jgi:hypothetical protein
MQGANQIALDAIEVQTGPLLTLEGLQLSPEQYVSPEPGGTTTARNISFQLRNPGQSPATRVVVCALIYSGLGTYSTWQSLVPCEDADKGSNDMTRPAADTVFAGPGIPKTIGASPFVYRDGHPRETLAGMQFLLVCIAYRGTFEDMVHHTKMLYKATNEVKLRANTPNNIRYIQGESLQLIDTETD